MKFLYALLACGIVVFNGEQTHACTDGGAPRAAPVIRDWWEVAQFYQIYPRSFKDSNGDGIGDLQGIISELDYLKEIGVTAAWLSPIYKSPMADFGYDIADFFDIQDEYGTLDDFDQLIAEAKKRDMKIIMDFVPNHSSDENVWFEKSVRREKGYEDYYMWSDGFVLENGTRVPPSNWLSAFRGSAWEWHPQRQQYYLHQFHKKQPDFNYRNPALVAQMKRVFKYWLDRGVAGFRIDAVPWCFEVEADATGRYPDEPLSGLTSDPENEKYLTHIYTQDRPETVDMVYQWRELMDDYQRIHGGDTRVLMIETYSEIDIVMQYYGNQTTKGAQMPFNFQFLVGGNPNRYNVGMKAAGYVRIIKSWFDNMPKGKTANWVMGNHDNHRVSHRYGEELVDTMNMIQMFLPGVSVTYNGEEIGMNDFNTTWAQGRDPAACNSNADIFQEFSRDPERTPMQWSSAANAGFSTNSNTWLPINPDYVTINVAAQRTQSKSHLSIYKQLVELRKTKTLQLGTVLYGAVGDNVLAIKRSLSNEKTYLLLANVLDQTVSADVTSLLKVSGNYLTIISSTISTRRAGDLITVNNFLLLPYESIIVESA